MENQVYYKRLSSISIIMFSLFCTDSSYKSLMIETDKIKLPDTGSF